MSTKATILHALLWFVLICFFPSVTKSSFCRIYAASLVTAATLQQVVFVKRVHGQVAALTDCRVSGRPQGLKNLCVLKSSWAGFIYE